MFCGSVIFVNENENIQNKKTKNEKSYNKNATFVV